MFYCYFLNHGINEPWTQQTRYVRWPAPSKSCPVRLSTGRQTPLPSLEQKAPRPCKLGGGRCLFRSGCHILRHGLGFVLSLSLEQSLRWSEEESVGATPALHLPRPATFLLLNPDCL